ncbi:ROK family protein [Arthrobacter sp. ok909]|nr:ROK family protein [Arthrobacter sp. ok909]
MYAPATPVAGSSSEAHLRIGIDVGGTWIKGASIDMSTGTPTGEVRHLPTPSDGTPEGVAHVLNQIIDDLRCGSSGEADLTVGVAIPSIVQHGVARSAANLDDSWIGLDVQAYLGGQLRLPVWAAGAAAHHQVKMSATYLPWVRSTSSIHVSASAREAPVASL